MKMKCTSKRKFKRIIRQMFPYVLFDSVVWEIYASEYYNCGLKTYKGINITYINRVWFKHNPHQIYIAPKGMWALPKNELKFKDVEL